jgi:hypothetical protein
MSTIYTTHRRINAPVEFKGLKGPYILFAGGTVVADLFLFAILHILGVNDLICLILCFGTGALGIGGAYHLSRRYGVHGWRKRRAARRLPKVLRCDSRSLFLELKK